MPEPTPQFPAYRDPQKIRDAEALVLEAVQLYEKNYVPDAIAKFQAAAELDPDNAIALVNLAKCVLRLGQYEQAIDYCKRALDLEPQNDWIKGYLKYAIFMFEHQNEPILQNAYAMSSFNCTTERSLAAAVDLLFLATAVVLGLLAKLPAPASAVIFFAVNWLALERWKQASLGKLLFGLRVVKLDGSPLTFGDTLKRLATLFCGDFLILSFLAVLHTPKHQRVGDLWARATVERVTKAKVPYHFELNR